MNGHEPPRRTLATLAGLKATTQNGLDTMVWQSTRRLVERGLLPPGKRGGAAAAALRSAEEPSAPKKLIAPIAKPAPVTRPARAEASDPVLSALIARRDALADKVAVLTSAIEAWQ